MTDEEVTRTTAELVQQKLTRAIKSLVKYFARDGRLDPDTQHAIRILESRQRIWDRIYTVQYGLPTLRSIAKLELWLDRDRGDLLALHGKKHGVGRLLCRACDYDYDNSGPVPVAVSLARLCSACSKGVQHCYSYPKPVSNPDSNGVSIPEPPSSTSLPVEIDSGSSQEGLNESLNDSQTVLWVRVYHCDYCQVEIEEI